MIQEDCIIACTEICIKCGSNGHKFYNCAIPKYRREMNDEHKAARCCANCNKKTDHTTLDHHFCPKIRAILRERVRRMTQTK